MNEVQKAIVVGIDGSEESRHAMAWAFDEAGRTHRHVHLLHVAYDYTYPGLVDGIMRNEFEAAALAVLEQARAEIPDDLKVPVTADWVWGTPAKALVDASAEAHMIVMGTRGHGRFMSGPLGSVSQHVMRHASCPVAVARPTDGAGTRVIVGFDPATPDPALQIAFDEATTRDLPLTVLRAWHVPAFAGPGLGVPATGYDAEDVERAERTIAEEQLQEWRGKFPDITVDIELTRGHPADVLVEASSGSDLVVVGSHGRGWFAGLLLGSTGAAVAAHAHSTVLVAR